MSSSGQTGIRIRIMICFLQTTLVMHPIFVRLPTLVSLPTLVRLARLLFPVAGHSAKTLLRPLNKNTVHSTQSELLIVLQLNIPLYFSEVCAIVCITV